MVDKGKCLAMFGWMVKSKHIWRQDHNDLMWSSHSKKAEPVWVMHFTDGFKVERQEDEVREELIS